MLNYMTSPLYIFGELIPGIILALVYAKHYADIKKNNK